MVRGWWLVVESQNVVSLLTDMCHVANPDRCCVRNLALQPHRSRSLPSVRGDSVVGPKTINHEYAQTVVAGTLLAMLCLRCFACDALSAIPRRTRLRQLGFEGEADRVDTPAFVGWDGEAFASENVPEVGTAIGASGFDSRVPKEVVFEQHN